VALTPFSLRGLPDHALLAALRELASRGACLEADLLVHLGEVDARELYLGRGYPSLFVYCTEVLHFSESIAYQRIAAARAARAFPRILDAVRSGELHLSAVRLLAPHLRRENCAELVEWARHKSKRAIEEMLADRAPKPDVPAQVRRLPEPVAGSAAPVRPSEARPAAAFGATVPGASSPAPEARPQLADAAAAWRSGEAPRGAVERACAHPEPLGAGRFKVTFTATAEAHAKLVEAQALLRHRIPDGDLAKLFDRALDALLREVRREKFAETDRPREARTAGGPAPRHIPAAIKRAVAARDQGRCTFVARDGRRCGSRDSLEFHHVQPFARSRRHRVEEIALRCRAHNRHAAIQDFGAEHMARFRRLNL
jgi:5-methylcytosine-specific restriction endonuclease McrA